MLIEGGETVITNTAFLDNTADVSGGSEGGGAVRVAGGNTILQGNLFKDNIPDDV